VLKHLEGPKNEVHGGAALVVQTSQRRHAVLKSMGAVNFHKEAIKAIKEALSKGDGKVASEKLEELQVRWQGMTLDEKYTLLHGLGYDMPDWWTVRKWWYVGNTAAIPRLSLPSLNMQDASGGFHTTWSEIVGTVTCWPSMLSMAGFMLATTCLSRSSF